MNTLAQARNKAAILRRLKAVRPDSARQWGRMTAHQMICHLIDSCRMATGEQPVTHATGFRERTIVKWIALYLPWPWPAGIRTSPELDQEAGGRCPADFVADIATLEALVEQLATPDRSRFEWPVHPTFGRMSEAAWLRWAYLHMDHHLRQFGA